MKKIGIRFFGIVGIVIIFFLPVIVGAHEIPISELNIVSDGSKMHLELVVNAHELKFMEEVDENNNGKIESDEVENHREAIIQQLVKALEIEINGLQVEAEASGVMMDLGSHHMIFRSHYPEKGKTRSLKLTSELHTITNQSHITRVTYTSSGEKSLARLDSRSNSVTFESKTAQQTAGLWRTIFDEYGVWMGIFAGLVVFSVLLYKVRKQFFIK